MPYRLLVDETNVAQARQAFDDAQREHRVVRKREQEGSAAVKASAAKLADAEAKVDACYETLTLRALPPRRVAELEAAHPPTEAQMERAKAERERAKKLGEDIPPWPAWNDDTFWPALLAECVDGDMTADDWVGFLAENVSGGEAAGLKTAVLNVNTAERVADPLVLPKDLTRILSSRWS